MKRSPFECDLCMEMFSVDRKPRILHCGHSYCGPCLHKLSVRNTIQCPDCQQRCKKKVNSLSINYKLMPSNEDKPTHTEEEPTQAEDKPTHTEDKPTQDENFCTTHKLLQKYWCAPCQVRICSECAVEAHKAHDFIKIEELDHKKLTEKHLYKDKTDKMISTLQNEQQVIKRIKEPLSSLLDKCCQVDNSLGMLLTKMLAGRAAMESDLATSFLVESFLAAAAVVDDKKMALQNDRGLEDEKLSLLQNWMKELEVRS